MCLQFVVYASLILDTLPFHASKDFSFVLDKAIKQSGDLKYVFVFVNLHTKSRYCNLLFPMLKYCTLIGCSLHTKSDIPCTLNLICKMTSTDQ